jgi:hypothetical protein
MSRQHRVNYRLARCDEYPCRSADWHFRAHRYFHENHRLGARRDRFVVPSASPCDPAQSVFREMYRQQCVDFRLARCDEYPCRSADWHFHAHRHFHVRAHYYSHENRRLGVLRDHPVAPTALACSIDPAARSSRSSTT